MSNTKYRKALISLAIKHNREKKPKLYKSNETILEDDHQCHLPRSKNGGHFKCNYCGKRYSLVYAPHGNYRWKKG